MIDEQIAAWWSDDGHDYFMVIISTMEKTQPGLVEQLKAKFVTDSGKYNGVGAMAYITLWLQRMHQKHPRHAYYEAALEVAQRGRHVAVHQGCRVTVQLASRQDRPEAHVASH